MKRRNYTISQDGQVLATKHAWNSARHEIRWILREKLNPNETAKLFSYDFKRDENNHAFVEGVEIWHTSEGRCLVFQIQQVQ